MYNPTPPLYQQGISNKDFKTLTELLKLKLNTKISWAVSFKLTVYVTQRRREVLYVSHVEVTSVPMLVPLQDEGLHSCVILDWLSPRETCPPSLLPAWNIKQALQDVYMTASQDSWGGGGGWIMGSMVTLYGSGTVSGIWGDDHYTVGLLACQPFISSTLLVASVAKSLTVTFAYLYLRFLPSFLSQRQ